VTGAPGRLVRLAETGSTNDDAREALLAGRARHGDAYVAEVQRAGRGRLGRAWESQRGDLFCSVVVCPSLAPERLPSLALAAAVAARATVGAFGCAEARLKWPNDLLVGERKLGGILVEGVFVGERLAGCVVGVGINLALDPAALPPEVAARATSLRALGLAVPAPPVVAEVLRAEVVAEARRLERDPDGVLAAWRANECTLGRAVAYDRAGAPRRGVAVDLDALGGLVVEEEGTGPIVLRSGEVTLRAPEAPSPREEHGPCCS
jgi:BirA family biotin operon repressor/biotin-[acetyl-CoA-carboxylase] ligase